MKMSSWQGLNLLITSRDEFKSHLGECSCHPGADLLGKCWTLPLTNALALVLELVPWGCNTAASRSKCMGGGTHFLRVINESSFQLQGYPCSCQDKLLYNNIPCDLYSCLELYEHHRYTQSERIDMFSPTDKLLCALIATVLKSNLWEPSLCLCPCRNSDRNYAFQFHNHPFILKKRKLLLSLFH